MKTGLKKTARAKSTLAPVLDDVSVEEPVEPPKQSLGAAVELVNVSKWGGAVEQIDQRFVRNEALQILIELAILTRHVKDRKKGRLGKKQLVPLLKDINLTIERGSVVGIVDIGGSSRYALLQILANCDVPATGAVRFFGKMVALQQLGAVKLSYLTIRENMAFDARLMGWPRQEVLAALGRVPEFSGMGKQLDVPIRRVPRGVVTDLGLSLLCCLDYDVIIVDEIGRPQSAKVTASWNDYLQHAPERGKTVILTGRNINKLLELSTHLLLIDKAELLAYGPAADLKTQYAAFLAKAHDTPLVTPTKYDDTEEDDDEDGDIL